jgi:RNA polymerase-associated protein CTR9
LHRLFSSLAADTGSQLPYSKDLAEQRRRYGDNMLRKKDANLQAQEAHEREIADKFKQARHRRQEEKDRAEAVERERQEALRLQAEQLAEQRRRNRAEIEELTQRLQDESDEERKVKEARKAKRAQARSAPVSGDEAEPDGGEAPSKKRKRKMPTKGRRKDRDEEPEALPTDSGEDEALFSGGDDAPARDAPRVRYIRWAMLSNTHDLAATAEEATSQRGGRGIVVQR